MQKLTSEQVRLQEVDKRTGRSPWELWGPYLSERQWGTVREDYSDDGDAWAYTTHDKAPQTAFCSGEDGIAGWSDRYQTLCFAPAFWNGQDKMLKERLFGLTGPEGNHGEDVKEFYYYADALPSHAYMKYVYFYPTTEFPYDELRRENARRTTKDLEYELNDTGAFARGFCSVTTEYAKESPQSFCVRITVKNPGDESVSIDLLMQLWFRNRWRGIPDAGRPVLMKHSANAIFIDDRNAPVVPMVDRFIPVGPSYFFGSPGGDLLFTENETAGPSLVYAKDAFHKYLVHNSLDKLPQEGTKGAFHYKVRLGGREEKTFHFSFQQDDSPLDVEKVDNLFSLRKREGDDFYQKLPTKSLPKELSAIYRGALSGLIWNKQIYLFDVAQWSRGKSPDPEKNAERRKIRNDHWGHLNSKRVLLMPDKWEYPWFAAWDLSFQAVAYSLLDLEFAKEQVWLLLFDQFQHPNGQVPAYEWEFSDLNPPVQAWAALHLYQTELRSSGKGDYVFLERCFHKLLINFTWWVNRVDSIGLNIFEGGFLGLDNITVVDRSQEWEEGVSLKQSDGTAWMAIFALNMLSMALILAEKNPVYEGLATKFFQHYAYIAHAMSSGGLRGYSLWCPEDGFFYDVLSYPDGHLERVRVRSLVGLMPLCATKVLTAERLAQFPTFQKEFHWFLSNRRTFTQNCVIPMEKKEGRAYFLGAMNKPQLQKLLTYLWDPSEFRARFGIRSLSRYHEKHPFSFEGNVVGYEPGESLEKCKGGNSNWRGPVWLPMNFLLIETLERISYFFGDDLQVHVPGLPPTTPSKMAKHFAKSVTSLFTEGESAPAQMKKLSQSPTRYPDSEGHLFYEYYHPESGRGLGASHQTGWSALVANLIHTYY